jgi:hypothetical protein
MIKRISPLTRKAGMTREQFRPPCRRPGHLTAIDRVYEVP